MLRRILPRNPEGINVKITRRYGQPGVGKFPYLFDTLANKYIVYAADMMAALTLYQTHMSYEPWSIRQMSDNE